MWRNLASTWARSYWPISVAVLIDALVAESWIFSARFLFFKILYKAFPEGWKHVLHLINAHGFWIRWRTITLIFHKYFFETGPKTSCQPKYPLSYFASTFHLPLSFSLYLLLLSGVLHLYSSPPFLPSFSSFYTSAVSLFSCTCHACQASQRDERRRKGLWAWSLKRLRERRGGRGRTADQ